MAMLLNKFIGFDNAPGLKCMRCHVMPDHVHGCRVQGCFTKFQDGGIAHRIGKSVVARSVVTTVTIYPHRRPVTPGAGTEAEKTPKKAS